MSLTLIPVFGLFFSASLLGETMRLGQFVGSAVVVGSIALLAIREARESQKANEPQPA